ncbi:LPS biosynthesis glycosyltransferase [Pedobacter yulinensis]|uniref:LPS biosynthesis glycosyltransferase n=1 Tax=Pedobacter yulinensis TaxID=2126353 RepID=A0A2T3HK47_9SPHI|nr:glycosyltransferase family 9 protein [Pedobacter yulinensis]PST82806.1 LPS biosynthesis glycosyltransferase [Pedobacter yulinensis]
MSAQSPKPFRIGIFRALQLGDLLCSIPAMRALRQAYPAARIELIGLPGARELAGRFPHYIDGFVDFPGYPGLPEQTPDAARFRQFVSEKRDPPYDLLLQMQGNGNIVNDMLQQLAPTRLAGFCQAAALQNENFLFYPADIHETERHLSLMVHLGIAAKDPDMEFNVTAADRRHLTTLALPLVKPYICVHPGSRGVWRQWPPVYFGAMADLCISNGFKVVLTGTKGEHSIAEEVAGHMRGQAFNACGLTDLGTLAALLEGAAGLLCNCTGISHLAAALRVPSVVISMDGEPGRWGPRNTELHETIDWTTGPGIIRVHAAMGRLFDRAGQVPRPPFQDEEAAAVPGITNR